MRYGEDSVVHDLETLSCCASKMVIHFWSPKLYNARLLELCVPLTSLSFLRWCLHLSLVPCSWKILIVLSDSGVQCNGATQTTLNEPDITTGEYVESRDHFQSLSFSFIYAHTHTHTPLILALSLVNQSIIYMHASDNSLYSFYRKL